MLIRCLILALCYAIGIGPAWAVTWYVGKSGSDANSCATAQSSTAANRKLTITAGLACVGGDTNGNTDGAGDTLIVGAGTYSEGISTKIPGGSSGNRFVFQCETIKDPTIGETPDCKISTPSTGQHSVLIDWSNWIDMKGFEIDGSSGDLSALNNYGSNSIFSYMRYYNAYYSCIYQEGDNNRHHHFTCVNNGIRNASYHADQGGPNDLYIPGSSNEFDHCVIQNSSAGVAFWHDTLTPQNDQIHHCLIQAPADVVGRTEVSGIGVYRGTGHKVYNNILNTEGLYAQFGASNAIFANNTVYANAHGGNCGILIDATASGTVVINNIFRSNTGGAVCNSGSGTTQTTNLSTDPSFVNPGTDFSLQSGSSARDTGTSTLAYGVTDDYIGTARPQNGTFDIGAYEYIVSAGGGGASGSGGRMMNSKGLMGIR